MTTTEILSRSNNPQMTAGLLEVIHRSEIDLGVQASVVAYSWDLSQEYVILTCGGYELVVLGDGTITDQTPD